MTKRTIVIKPLDNLIERFGNQLGAVGSAKGRVALARAVNRTTRTVHGRVIRAVSKQSGIPVAIVRRSVKMKLAAHSGDGAIEGSISAYGEPISLKYFGAKQFAFGVRAKVYGKWERHPGAFMGPRPGVIAKRLNGHVYMRTGSSRLPIEKLYGPSVPGELLRGESARIFNETVATMLPERVAHELGGMLAGAEWAGKGVLATRPAKGVLATNGVIIRRRR